MFLIIQDIYNAIFAWAQNHYILTTIILGIILAANCYLLYYVDEVANYEEAETVMMLFAPLLVVEAIVFVMSGYNVIERIDDIVTQKYTDYKAVHTKPKIKTTTMVEKTPDINTNIKAVITENGISREVNINVNSYELDNNSLNIITDNVKQSIVNINNQRLNKEY